MVNFKDTIKFTELQGDQRNRWNILCNKFQSKKREISATVTDAQRELPKVVDDKESVVQRKFLNAKLDILFPQ